MKIRLRASTLMLASALLMGMVNSQNAHAIVGLSSGNPGLAIAGGVTMGAAVLSPGVLGAAGCVIGLPIGLVAGGGRGAAVGCGAGFVVGVWTGVWAAGPAFLVGLIMLDGDEAGNPIGFRAINADQAKILGLTDSQLISYNEDLASLNAVYEKVVAAQIKANDFSTSFARAQWALYSDEYSSEAYQVVVVQSEMLVMQLNEKQSRE